MARATVLISGLGIAGPALPDWLVRQGHRPVLVERADEPRWSSPRYPGGAHKPDDVSAVRPDGHRTYDVAPRSMHETHGNREIPYMSIFTVDNVLGLTDQVLLRQRTAGSVGRPMFWLTRWRCLRTSTSTR